MNALRALPFTLALTIPASVALGWWLGGWWTFLTVGYSFLFMPLIDRAVGPRFTEREASAGSWAFDAALYAVVPVVLGLIGWALWVVATEPLTTVDAIGFTVSTGVAMGGIGITAAHEFIHRRTAWERGLGLALLAAVTNLQFRIAHVHGHHRDVATPRDPASADVGDNALAFIWTSYWGQHLQSWRIEAERLRRRGAAVWGPRNRMLWYLAVQGAIWGGIAAGLGWWALAFFAAQSYVANAELELVNYLEHYGLRRREVAPGTYEPFDERHAWNCSNLITNWYLFNLAKHSRHHVHAGLPYDELGDRPETPQLPAGYAAMVLLAQVPPLWRRVMDPRVERWRAAHRAA